MSKVTGANRRYLPKYYCACLHGYEEEQEKLQEETEGNIKKRMWYRIFLDMHLYTKLTRSASSFKEVKENLFKEVTIRLLLKDRDSHFLFFNQNCLSFNCRLFLVTNDVQHSNLIVSFLNWTKIWWPILTWHINIWTLKGFENAIN